ncbi:MAG: hypothetical protein ACI86C_001693, partial [Candidatus Latescibacterota bacterium]
FVLFFGAKIIKLRVLRKLIHVHVCFGFYSKYIKGVKKRFIYISKVAYKLLFLHRKWEGY